jgi:pimeloyl-ACP methyl ester carboxylesterase
MRWDSRDAGEFHALDAEGVASSRTKPTKGRTAVPNRLAFLCVAAAVPSIAWADGTPGRVDIGNGRQMYIECRGEGAPAVVIIPGGTAAADDWTEAEPGKLNVFDAVGGFTRVCAYDRPGVPLAAGLPSRSDPTPQPRTAADAVADLHALIAAAGIQTPVVLVGHSYGGLVDRLYARTWPDQVAGMVLVDALAEGLRSNETPEEWVNQKAILQGDLTETLKIYPDIERDDPDKSFDQLEAAPPLKPMPVVVLSADFAWGPLVAGLVADGRLAPDTPPDVGYVTDRAQKVAQAAIAAEAPGARHVTKTDSGHEIHKDQPQLVLDSIRDVVEAVRAGRTSKGP